MFTIKTNSKSIQSFETSLDVVSKEVEEAVLKEMMDISEHYIGEVKKRALRKTGDLRKSITRTDIQGNPVNYKGKVINGKIEVFVGSNLPYAHRREEEDLKNPPTTPNTDAHFFKRALLAYIDKYIKALQEAVIQVFKG